MNDWNPRANQVFLDALDIDPGQARDQFITRACDGDAALRDDVDGLLEAHLQAGGLLDGAMGDPKQTTPFTPVSGEVEFEHSSVGPYKLQSVIAEGGMGIVYEAEQEEPVRRTVALKIIRPGMDSREVIARFEVERQTLALMDHPNIASVLDAGSTESGQPYFVMELVRGRPITAHCDDGRLTVRERLKLFIQVCHAVQHAHQKGIIHRDIKPSNVLVTMKDGVAVPKVIDFGVAKALDQPLNEQSIRTRFAQMVGTPLYMSPEQASIDGIDVDTRSDIFSLGVLLYELLTGTTPCESERMEKADYAEFRRIKCDVEPPRPSMRVGMLQGDVETISDCRGTEPIRLVQALRRELDWIVMKALEKDRQRRYQTVRGFADDVSRYLNNEIVEAGPPSKTYRVRKFIGRYRTLIGAAALVFIVLLLGTGVSVWQAVRATNAERLARSRLVIANNALKAVEEANERSRRNQAQALSANGSFLAAVKRYDQALHQFQSAIKVDPSSPFLNNNFAWFLATCPNAKYRDPTYAVQLAHNAVELVPQEATFWNTLGVCYYRQGNWQKAIEALERSSQYFGDDAVGFNATFIAMAQWQLGNREEAQRQYDLAVNWMRENELVDEELYRFCREAAELLGRSETQHQLEVRPETAK